MFRSAILGDCLALPAPAQVPASLSVGPRVAFAAVTGPQYTRVDQPGLRDFVREPSGEVYDQVIAPTTRIRFGG